jgi:2-hydroxy-4-carboxymuconate semialdehyde hemiacetal dehydrogenase
MAAHHPIRIGMIGHGMMGVWHSRNLAGLEAVPHTVVGRRTEPTEAFAEEHGYARATTDLDAMLADPDVDAVVVGSPSEAHVEHSLAAIAAKKHVLIEIPIAMDLAGAERVAEAARRSDRVVAVCHPWRHRPELVALKERLDAGEERLGFVEGRFLIHRLENVGATGYRRSWTDSILWHHAAHLVDLGCWLLGPDLQASGWLAPVDGRTGTPMATSITLERGDGASAHLLLTYLSHLKHNEATATTERDSYRIDIPNALLATSAGAGRSNRSRRTAGMCSPTSSRPAGQVADRGSRPLTSCPACGRCRWSRTRGTRAMAPAACRGGSSTGWAGASRQGR